MKRFLLIITLISLFLTEGMSYTKNIETTTKIQQSNIYLDEARNLVRKNNLIEAENKLNLALLLNDNNENAYYTFGQIEEAKGNYDKAINYYTKAIQIKPHNDEFYYARGCAQSYNYNLIAVINDMNKAIELNPKNGKAYGFLAASYCRFGYFEEALDYVNKAIQYDKSTLDMLYPARAELYVILKKYDSAINDYKKAIIEIKKRNNINKSQNIEQLKLKIFEIQEGKKVFKQNI